MGEALDQRKVQDKGKKREGFGDQSRVSGIQWEKGMEALIWHAVMCVGDLAICIVLLDGWT